MFKKKKWNHLLTWLLSVLVIISTLLIPESVVHAEVVGDNYPYKNQSGTDEWNFYKCQCTSFVAWRLNSRNGVPFHNYYQGVQWGHAKDWAAAARSVGITVDNTPAVGAVACQTSGKYGHVAWVADVNGSNVTIEEYNYNYSESYNKRTVSASSYCYIHIKDVGIVSSDFMSYMKTPASGGNYSGPIGILGYALHKNGIRNVTAWVNGQSMDCPMYNSPDVAEVYPGYPTGNEGFQAQIPISCLKEGENKIEVYAYEGDDTPHLIASHNFNWNSFIGKLESPVQNGSYNGTLSIQGYALHKNGIRNVTAWVNGQSMDCPMYERTEIATKYSGYPTGNEGFKTEIPISCLKYGENEINIFAYEANDYPHNIASYKFNYVKDTTAPTISDVRVTDLNAEGYTVTCRVEDADGVAKVQFPTWTAVNDQDDLIDNWWDNPKCRGTQDGTTWSFRVNDKEHNFERGIYHTHIYAYDNNGNRSCYELNWIEFQNTYSKVNTASYNGHTYYLYNDILTWHEAKEKCENLGGHLVTITSTGEQKTVAKLIKGQARIGYWIGGSNDNGSSWVSKEAFSFSNWEPGEPNNDKGIEDCYGIYTDKGTWNDWQGSNSSLGLGFICEWDEKKVEKPDNPNEQNNPAGSEPERPEESKNPTATTAPAEKPEETETPATTQAPMSTPAPTATSVVTPIATPVSTAIPTVTQIPAATPVPTPTTTVAQRPTATIIPAENPEKTELPAVAQAPTITPAPAATPTITKPVVVKKLNISSVKCKKNTKKITGKISVSEATVKIKVDKKPFKKATIKGNGFELKLKNKLKKGTRIIIKITKKDYKSLIKSYVVK